MALHHLAIHVLTWGTIAGAVISALLLAAFDRSPQALPDRSSWSPAIILADAPPQAGAGTQAASAPAASR